MDTPSTRPLVSGTFRDREAADRAYASFRERGYSDDDMHIMMSDDTKKAYFDRDDTVIDEGSKAMEGAGAGATIGGSLGGILGAIAGIGATVALPGLGLAIAGPIAGALAGAGAGGAAGSLVGALVGAGIPEEHAKMYEDDIKDGGIVMGVHPRDDDYDTVQQSYTSNGASNVYSSRTAPGSAM